MECTAGFLVLIQCMLRGTIFIQKIKRFIISQIMLCFQAGIDNQTFLFDADGFYPKSYCRERVLDIGNPTFDDTSSEITIRAK